MSDERTGVTTRSQKAAVTDSQPSPDETEDGSVRNQDSLFEETSRSLFLPATLEEAVGRVEERMMDPDYSASYREVVEDEELPSDINLVTGLMAKGFQGVVEATLNKNFESLREECKNMQRSSTNFCSGLRDEVKDSLNLTEENSKRRFLSLKEAQERDMRRCMLTVARVEPTLQNEMRELEARIALREKQSETEIKRVLRQDVEELTQELRNNLQEEMKELEQRSIDRERQNLLDIKKTIKQDSEALALRVTTRTQETEATLEKRIKALSAEVKEVKDQAKSHLDKATELQEEYKSQSDLSQMEISGRMQEVETGLQKLVWDVAKSSKRSETRSPLREPVSPPVRPKQSVRLSTVPTVIHESTRRQPVENPPTREPLQSRMGTYTLNDVEGSDRDTVLTSSRGEPSGNYTVFQTSAMQPANEISLYCGVKKSGFIDDWLETVSQACEAYNYNEKQKVYTITMKLDDPIKEHLHTYADDDLRTYDQIAEILRKKYGVDRERENVRNSFQLQRQEQDEGPEDFLDRLMRLHKIGWPDANQQRREREVLHTLTLGLRDANLSNTLDMEYQKPYYQHHPPRMSDVRSYIQRLENSRELRRRKMEMGNQHHQPGNRRQQATLREYLNPPEMERPPPRHRICWNCKDFGHFAWQCTKPKVYSVDPNKTASANLPKQAMEEFDARIKGANADDQDHMINQVVEQQIGLQGPNDPAVRDVWYAWAQVQKVKNQRSRDSELMMMETDVDDSTEVWVPPLTQEDPEYFEIECAGFREIQSLERTASSSLIKVNVFLKCLKEMGRWDEQVTTPEEIKQMILEETLILCVMMELVKKRFWRMVPTLCP